MNYILTYDKLGLNRLKLRREKEQATQVGLASVDMLKDPKFREFYNEMLLNTIEKYKELKNGKI